MKVIGAGFGRTGTMSLKVALEDYTSAAEMGRGLIYFVSGPVPDGGGSA